MEPLNKTFQTVLEIFYIFFYTYGPGHLNSTLVSIRFRKCGRKNIAAQVRKFVFHGKIWNQTTDLRK
jgi:hypothetical protein